MYEFKLPDLGEGIHEGQIVNVLVKEGDTIKEFEPMLEVETDKAAVEIPSPKSGKVSKVNVKPGQTVKVGEVMLAIDTGEAAGAGEAAQPGKPATTAAPAKAATRPQPANAAPAARPGAPVRPGPAPASANRPGPAPARPASPSSAPAGSTPARPAPSAPLRTAAVATAPASMRPAAVAAPAAPAESRREGPVPAAPVVRKLARELGVDLAAVQASGPSGRVLKEDVERFSMGHRGGAVAGEFVADDYGANGDGAVGGGASGASGHGVMVPAEALPDFSQYGPIRREGVPQIRKTIARQMTRAWLNVPRVTHGEEIDITDVERNRKKYNEKLKEGQAKLSVTAIVMKAVAVAIQEHPKFNCSFDAQANEVIYKDYVNLGVAVDGPRGLIVPVVRDCHVKSLPQIAADLNAVAQKVKDGKIEIADLRGATFTVTNVGALGGTFATPMVNYPEVAILGMAKASMRPMWFNEQVVPRMILPLFMSFDHRIIDGADAARFCTELKDMLENPLRLLGT